jgi:hypothetical protein
LWRRDADAETEFRSVLGRAEKVLGPENPDTLATRDNLAEAKALAERAVEGAQKLQGIEHPDTKKYRQLLDSLQ